MSHDLEPGQRALLIAVLQAKRQALLQELDTQQNGQDRVEHAAELLQQDADELPAHSAERELDQARGNHLLGLLAQIDAALQKAQEPSYGHCGQCGEPIAFERLQHSPEAQRCLKCQAALEAGRRA